jgi:hypothetical protein
MGVLMTTISRQAAACLLIILYGYSLSAQKEDYNMLWGGIRGTPDDQNYYLTILNFNNQLREVSNLVSDRKYLPGQNTGVISDAEGNLLFYSNGCFVMNNEHEMMENGDDINIGEYYSLIGDCQSGYRLRNMMILPDPGYEYGYYLLHKRVEFMPRITDPEIMSIGTPAFMYSYIDMAENNGLGKVMEKNVEVFRRDARLPSSFIHAVKHANGRDWWVVQPLDTSNIYYSIMIDDTGINLKDSTRIGPKLHPWTSSSGQLKFSPDGEKLALVSAYNGLYIIDFDRSTGQLSNFKATSIPDTVLFMGMEWSSSGRYIYTSNGDNLWQYDTYSDNMHESRVLIGVWDGSSNPLATRFGMMQRGPDCRIYMSSFSSTVTIHVINQPDLPGEECDFRQHGLDLLGVSTRSVSMPIFPNFRLDTGPVCDPEIATSVREPVFSPVQQMSLYPNPAREYVSMSLPPEQTGSGTFTLYDMQGRLVYSRYIYNPGQIPLYNVHSGLYIVHFVADDGRAYRGKLVKE